MTTTTTPEVSSLEINAGLPPEISKESLNMSLEDQLLMNDNDEASIAPSPVLSRPLAMLFSINGITLALPATSLLYIVNTRVEMPLSLIPTYAAISFLPFSLKPMYAVLSSRRLLGSWLERHHLISILLLVGALTIVGTAWVPSGGVVGCFFIAFANCFANAWSEFLLGLCLVEDAARFGSSVGVTAASFQSQAATHRNTGSLVAYLMVWLWMMIVESPTTTENGGNRRYLMSLNGELNARIVTQLFMLTGLFYVVGSVVAHVWTVGKSSRVSTISYERIDNPEHDALGDVDDGMIASHSTTWKETSIRLIVLLQITIVLISLKHPLEKLTSSSSWIAMMIAIAISWCFVVRVAVSNITETWPRSHRTGLYLILRHAIPSVSYLMESFMYEAFASTVPTFLTILSVWEMVILSLASWSYGVLFRNCHRDYKRMIEVIICTTVFAALSFWIANNLLIVMLRSGKDDNGMIHVTWTIVLTTLAFKTILTVAGEWKFLPDVILATTTACISESHENRTLCSHSVSRESDSVGLRYGSLIGCIDFGGMIGSLLAVPLVRIYGTSRENDWANLESLILTGAIATLLSAGLTILLKK